MRLGDPSVDLVTALAIETFPPDLATLQRGRDFAAWLGLLQKQHSSLGGKNTLAFANKMLHKWIERLERKRNKTILQSIL